MTQFIKQTILVTLFVSGSFAEHQIDLSAGGVVSSGLGLRVNGDYRGTQIVNDHLSFRGGSTLNIITKSDSPYNKMEKFPFLIDGELETMFGNDIHQGIIRTEADVTKNAKPIGFPLSAVDNNSHVYDDLTHFNGKGVGVQYRFEHTHFEIDAFSLYRNDLFKRYSKKNTALYHEGDLYVGGTAHGLFREGSFFAGVSILNKNDLNTSDNYNWTETSVEAGTNLIRSKRKTMVFSQIALTDLQGDVIAKNGYTTGIGSDYSCRFVQKITRSFWVKGDFELETKKETAKGRFGGSLRKTFGNGSIEGGYWSTKGSLFPRQCTWATGTVNVFDNFLDVESALKNYWVLRKEENTYYRTDLSMELSLHPIRESRKVVVSGGGLWRSIPESQIAGSGVELFMGVKTIL